MARIDGEAKIGAIGQSVEDVVKIGVSGESGSYVLCFKKDKAIELYDRGNSTSLWTMRGN